MQQFQNIFYKNCRRYFSDQRNLLKTVFISKSKDIFINLALEDWLYKNLDFTKQTILMLWQNMPCVVIGRHQNPWIECNFTMLPFIDSGVKLARRNSGGGTVYHDLGNLNLTFFTNRNDYNRKKNLELISRSLNKSFDINTEISSREDLCINGLKISGTASKLGRNNAYHHCTILVNVNKANLSLALKNSIHSMVKTNATRSIKSDIMNLCEQVPTITIDQIMQSIINEFTKDISINKNQNVKVIESIDENQYPGIIEIQNEYLSKKWRYTKTPQFEIYQTIHFTDDNQVAIENNNVELMKVFFIVENGIVREAGLKYKDKILNCNKTGYLSDIFNGLIKKEFNYDVLKEFEMIVTALRNSQICRNLIETG